MEVSEGSSKMQLLSAQMQPGCFSNYCLASSWKNERGGGEVGG